MSRSCVKALSIDKLHIESAGVRFPRQILFVVEINPRFYRGRKKAL